MTMRELQRLCKIDEEIVSLRISFERERQHELLTGKRTLLLSKGLKAQIDRAMKSRKVLADAIKTKPTQKAVFALKLAERKAKLDDAIAELPSLEQHKAQCAAALVVDNNPDTKLAFKEAEYEVMRQKSRIGALEYSYTAFSKKSEYIPERQTRNKLPADYSAKADLGMLEEEQAPQSEFNIRPTRIEDTAFGQSEAYLDERKAVSIVPAGLLDAPIVTQQSEPKRTFTFNEMAAMHAEELQQPRKRPVIG
jgi:hypothetical protein